MFTGKFEFKKVELEVNKRGSYGARKGKTVYLSNHDRRGKRVYYKLNITGDLIDSIGWKPEDRVDLLQCGKMFALQKSDVGLFSLRKASSRNTGSLCINSQNLCLHLITETNRCDEYKAWIDGDMIIFIPVES